MLSLDFFRDLPSGIRFREDALGNFISTDGFGDDSSYVEVEDNEDGSYGILISYNCSSGYHSAEFSVPSLDSLRFILDSLVV